MPRPASISVQLFSLATLIVAASPGRGSAQTPPRVMVAVDTSGSMALSLDGVPTFGDGVLTDCTQMSGGHYCGTDCMAGIDIDCDGEPNDSRMYVANEAIRNLMLAYGDDVDWALPLWPLGELARPFVRRELDRIFDFREETIRAIFAGEEKDT